MFYGAEVAVYSKINTKQINTMWSESTGYFIMNVPILKPYISATTNPK
jgi:hypothetical protein